MNDFEPKVGGRLGPTRASGSAVSVVDAGVPTAKAMSELWDSLPPDARARLTEAIIKDRSVVLNPFELPITTSPTTD
jgi:hypothetical protein